MPRDSTCENYVNVCKLKVEVKIMIVFSNEYLQCFTIICDHQIQTLKTYEIQEHLNMLHLLSCHTKEYNNNFFLSMTWTNKTIRYQNTQPKIYERKTIRQLRINLETKQLTTKTKNKTHQFDTKHINFNKNNSFI